MEPSDGDSPSSARYQRAALMLSYKGLERVTRLELVSQGLEGPRLRRWTTPAEPGFLAEVLLGTLQLIGW